MRGDSQDIHCACPFLTARAQESDKLIGLTAGGDDYLPKPFSYAELIARVKALLRRYCVYRGKESPVQPCEGNYLELGNVRIARDHNEVWVKGKEISLTEIEYQILFLLMKSPGRIFSTQNIYETIWNEPYFYISNGTVMVHIRKLRVKIEDDSQEPKYIQTVWGKGIVSRKAEPMRNYSGMGLRFIRLLLIAALCSFLMMGFLHYGGNIIIGELLEKTDFQAKRTENRVNAFQSYVKKQCCID